MPVQPFPAGGDPHHAGPLHAIQYIERRCAGAAVVSGRSCRSLPQLSEDGTLNRSVTASGTGISMFGKTVDREAGWKFIEWFTSDDIQYQFGSELELAIGPMARFETANANAFEMLPWAEKEKGVIRRQWEDVRMTMQTPVSYYLARNISYAFRNVVYKQANPREMLNRYNNEINKEISRKRKALGLPYREVD
jgi:ABC-type glycerol-3-phosphate transport system substrate-binding protein